MRRWALDNSLFTSRRDIIPLSENASAGRRATFDRSSGSERAHRRRRTPMEKHAFAKCRRFRLSADRG